MERYTVNCKRGQFVKDCPFVSRVGKYSIKGRDVIPSVPVQPEDSCSAGYQYGYIECALSIICAGSTLAHLRRILMWASRYALTGHTPLRSGRAAFPHPARY